MVDDKTRRDVALQDYEAQSAEALARIDYQVDYSKALLNALTVGNGGAILAILTFIGNTGAKVAPATMKGAFIGYGVGLACVFAGYAAGFFTQFYFYRAAQEQAWNAQAAALAAQPEYDPMPSMHRGNIALGLAIALAMASLVAFVWASLLAIEALT